MERWYRQFLIVVGLSTFVFIPIELGMSGHTEEFVQWIPFIASGLAIASVVIWRIFGKPWTLVMVKGVMLSVCATCFWGIYEHFIHNLEFELEIRPGTAWTDVFWSTMLGASPLLAPGILFLAGIMILAATKNAGNTLKP